MSQAPHSHDEEGPIKTPKQLIVAVVLAFVLPIFIIVLLVMFVNSTGKQSAGSDSMSAEAIARRIMPVGTVDVQAPSAAPGAHSGEDVYKSQCVSCHSAGLAGAPKFGDAAAWAPRIGQGLEALWNSAMKGKGAMPPQGAGEFNGDEIKRAVVYMANAGGAKFTAPAVAAASAPAESVVVGETASAPTAASVAAPIAVAAMAAPAKAVTAGVAPALYGANCVACHASGVMNAPKIGDKAAWAPRLAAGVDGLTASAIKGKNMMPPRGGATNATDAEIRQVVAYMVEESK